MALFDRLIRLGWLLLTAFVLIWSMFTYHVPTIRVRSDNALQIEHP